MVACYRHIWELVPDERSRALLRVAERHADGLVEDDEFHAVGVDAGVAADAALARNHAVPKNITAIYAMTGAASVSGDAAEVAVFAATSACAAAATAATGVAVAGSDNAWTATHRAEGRVQCHLLRDIFGNLFRAQPGIDPGWLTWNSGTVKRLAEAIYEQREMPSGHLDNALLGVLADALEEVGCRDGDILTHCRERGSVHVRGCFVVDLLLGKS
jgi:hypothetical protein